MRYLLALFIFGYLIINAEENNAVNSTASFWQLYSNALRGDKVSQFQVGVLYERGKGVEQNQTLAAQWYEKSALQGYIDAQYNIALMYATGRGVEQNERYAMMWFASAAKQGDQEARKVLLNIIDGTKEVKKKKTPEVHTDTVIADTNVTDINNVSINTTNSTTNMEIISIKPTTLITKVGAQVCDIRNQCEIYKSKTALTSISKRGNQYKISGIVSKRGWQAYKKDGWINEDFVDIRH